MQLASSLRRFSLLDQSEHICTEAPSGCKPPNYRAELRIGQSGDEQSTETCRNMTSAVWAHDRYSTATAPSAECTGNSARRSAGLKLSHRSLELMILRHQCWKEGAPEDDSSTSFGCQCVVFRVKMGKVFPSLFSNRLLPKGAGYQDIVDLSAVQDHLFCFCRIPGCQT